MANDEATRKVRSLLSRLESRAADVYWYPGSGNDLTPLLLGIDDSRFGRVLYQPDSVQERPLFLWMSDNGLLSSADESPLEALRREQPYEALWRKFHATLEIVAAEPLGCQIWLVTVDVDRGGSEPSRYQLVFSDNDAEHDCRLLCGRGLSIDWTILIAQACTGLYAKIPRWLLALETYPTVFVTDANSRWEESFPEPLRSKYERVYGGGVRGWGQGKPSVSRLLCRTDRWEEVTRALPRQGRADPSGRGEPAPRTVIKERDGES